MVNKYAYVTGGADRQCMSLAGALRTSGHDVAFLAMESSRNVETRGAFVPTVMTRESRDELGLRQRAHVLRNAIWNVDAAESMRRLLRDFAPDVIHVHRLYPQLSVAPVVEARGRGLPIVQTLHDYEFLSASAYDATGGWFDRREPRWSYRLLNTGTFVIRRRVHARAVAAWIAVSDHVAAVHEVRGIRAAVIPNFADVDRARTSLSFDQRTGVAFLGALTPEKGVRDVLALARDMRGVSVTIAGRGPLESEVEREAAALPNVVFRGHLDSVAAAQAMSAARVVLVPSRWEEPFSLVAVEAMAMGTPVVAYRAGGLGENVARSGAGLTVDADWRALAAASSTLLFDRDLWQTCSRAGHEAANGVFSKEAHVRAVLAVYDRARRRHRSARVE